MSLICLLFIVNLAGWGQPYITAVSRVTDAVTGEALPCVGIRVDNGRTTVTNIDGDFSIGAQPTDTLRLTCVGYETLRICAGELPKVVAMQPTTTRMAEITIRSVERMMTEISRQTKRAFDKTYRSRSQYFYRSTSAISNQQDIVEAIVDSRSAVNVRDVRFISGRHWGGKGRSPISDTNIYHILELAPMMAEAGFWSDVVTPLARKRSVSDFRRLYEAEVEELEHEGHGVYKIHLKCQEGRKDGTPIMTGTLYVTSDSLRLVRFDGEVDRVNLDFKSPALQHRIRVPLTLSLHIDYGYRHGVPEVDVMTVEASQADFHTRTLLFNISGMDARWGRSRRMYADDNMLKAIDAVGYDSTYWENSEIVRRTEEESMIALKTMEHKPWYGKAAEGRDSLSPLERLTTRASMFGQRIPQEKVYVQMDNTAYQLGDTVWFAAYTRRTDTGRPSRVSRVLYAELWNHDGFMVERKLVEMRDGRGHSFFALPDSLYGGFYELRAYTRWQLNWGQTKRLNVWRHDSPFYNRQMEDEYYRDYEKLYSRVFPVYDKPKEGGDYARNMTLRPLRRYFRKDPDEASMLLSLFPEGGSAVTEAECRVAFEAAMQDGEAREGVLHLMTGNDTVVIARTENRGRGTFTFTPQKRKTYKAVFVADGDGIIAKAELKDITEVGVALRIFREDSLWNICINSTLERPLGLTVMHEGVTSHFTQTEAKPDFRYSIPNSELPAGVNQVTVFDSDGCVWADRLFFASRIELSHPTVSVSGLKENYTPFEEVSIDISAPDSTQSVISLSVRDGQRGWRSNDSGNIMTEMLLSSEIRGFVPQPEWYFESDDEEHRRALDLLMMTQGWRRFSWREMAVDGAWELTHPAEQSQVLTGTVNKYVLPYRQGYDGNKAPNYLRDLNQCGIYSNGTDSLVGGNTFIKPTAATPLDRSAKVTNPAEGLKQYEIYDMVKAQREFSPNRQFSGGVDHLADKSGTLCKEVKVHAEFVKPDAPKGETNIVTAEMETKDRGFRIEVPRYYGNCVFFLTAKDTTLWDKKMRKLWIKKYRQHNWVQMEDDEYTKIHEDAEYYVRLSFPYPRWVKPYSYYHTHEAPYRDTGQTVRMGDDKVMDELTVRSRHNGLRRIDLSKPAFVLDAYEAANAAMDAGLLTDLYNSSVMSPDGSYTYLGYGNTSEMANAAVLNYVGDMGMMQRYSTSLFWDSVRVAGAGMKEFALFDHSTQRQYSRLEYIDKIYLYTDYSPRMEGSKRYRQTDQPSVEILLHHLPENMRRVTYRDRRYILPGFAYQEDFYHPDYHRNPPREGQRDYRRTIYWNPDLQLDAKGHTRIRFFTGSRPITLSVEAAGQTADGNLLYTE